MDGFDTNKKTVELQLTKLLANSYYFKHNLTPGTLLTHFSSSHHYYAIISRCRLSDTHISTQKHTKHTHTQTHSYIYRDTERKEGQTITCKKKHNTTTTTTTKITFLITHTHTIYFRF